MESTSSSPQLRRSAYSDGDAGTENLRSQRSSVVINWSDGSKAIFIRPPRPHSDSGWSSPLPPPSSPPASVTPRPVPIPRPPSSSNSRRAPQILREDSSWRETSGISRLSSLTRAEVGQRAPRTSMGRNERPSSRHSYHAPSPQSSVGGNERSSTRHSHYPPSPRPSTHRRTATSQLRTPSRNNPLGSNIIRPESAPINVFNVCDYRSSDNTPSDASLESTVGVVGRITPVTRRSPRNRAQSQSPREQMRHRGRQDGADQRGPVVIHVEANIRERGSMRPPMRIRTGEGNGRSADGSGGRFRNGEGRDEENRRGQGRGDFMRTLGRYLHCLPFSPRDAEDTRGYERGSRSGSRHCRSGRR